ncbi:MAG TPA: hypothetical protein VK941_03095 [Gillisia sp.]|nr:hypothetical protein [Gillisia sp.]
MNNSPSIPSWYPAGRTGPKHSVQSRKVAYLKFPSPYVIAQVGMRAFA